MERIAIYPGSFDPITAGHMDIIRRGLKLFDRIIVLITHNPDKKGCFPVEERLRLIRKCCEGLPGVSCDSYTGLTTEYAVRAGACAMLRGLRAGDWAGEQNLALINSRLAPEVETLFLSCMPEHSMVSSSAVRELASYGASLEGYVLPCIEADIRDHFLTLKQKGNGHG